MLPSNDRGNRRGEKRSDQDRNSGLNPDRVAHVSGKIAETKKQNKIEGTAAERRLPVRVGAGRHIAQHDRHSPWQALCCCAWSSRSILHNGRTI